MKVVIALAVLVAVAVAAPQGGPDKDAHILKYDSDNIGVEGFKWAYETSNGIAADEAGQVVNAGSEQESIAVRGSFTYTGPDGTRYQVNYIADENGFQPEGAHIPKAA